GSVGRIKPLLILKAVKNSRGGPSSRASFQHYLNTVKSHDFIVTVLEVSNKSKSIASATKDFHGPDENVPPWTGRGPDVDPPNSVANIRRGVALNLVIVRV